MRDPLEDWIREVAALVDTFNRLEGFTEELWAAFSQAIADAGIDL